jgi:hypothetical protein
MSEKTVIKIERVGELYGVEQFEVMREGEGVYAATMGYGSLNADFYMQMTAAQLIELRDALNREVSIYGLEATVGGTGPKLIGERLRGGTLHEAIGRLALLQAEHVGARLYLPEGFAPSVSWTLWDNREVCVTWGSPRWVVRLWDLSSRGPDHAAVLDTLTECMAWLKGRDS